MLSSRTAPPLPPTRGAPTVAALAAALRCGAVRATDLLDEQLARAAQHHAALNAIVVLDADRARVDARVADAALAAGECLGPLHGVPATVKDTFEMVGLPTSNGLARPRPAIATRDATVVARLRAAGAIVFGKTNVPLASYDLLVGRRWQDFALLAIAERVEQVLGRGASPPM